MATEQTQTDGFGRIRGTLSSAWIFGMIFNAILKPQLDHRERRESNAFGTKHPTRHDAPQIFSLCSLSALSVVQLPF